MATEKRYSVQSISIRRPFGKDGDYDASVNVTSTWGDEIKIKLPEGRVEGFIDSVSDLILESLNAHFTNMKDDFRNHVEEKRLAALPVPSVEGEVAVDG